MANVPSRIGCGQVYCLDMFGTELPAVDYIAEEFPPGIKGGRGKSPINEYVHGKFIEPNCGFSMATFDDRISIKLPVISQLKSHFRYNEKSEINPLYHNTFHYYPLFSPPIVNPNHRRFRVFSCFSPPQPSHSMTLGCEGVTVLLAIAALTLDILLPMK